MHSIFFRNLTSMANYITSMANYIYWLSNWGIIIYIFFHFFVRPSTDLLEYSILGYLAFFVLTVVHLCGMKNGCKKIINPKRLHFRFVALRVVFNFPLIAHLHNFLMICFATKTTEVHFFLTI